MSGSKEPLFDADAWRPNPGRQELFIRHPANVVGYGGAAGSGKTDALIFHHIYIAEFETQRWFRNEIEQSRGWGIYFRRLASNLEDSKARFLAMVPKIDRMNGTSGWNESKGTYTYRCGFKYKFAGLEKPRDYMKFQSFQFIEEDFDELTEFEQDQYDWLQTRKRSPDPELRQFLNTRWGSNPVGPGLEWVRRRWIAGKASDQTYRYLTKIKSGKVIPSTEVFIQAFLADNHWLAEDGQYEADLIRNQPHIARIMLEGDWWAQKGNFLGAFWDPRIHVCPQHRIPRNTFRFRSCDFGIGSHSSITWWYVDQDGCFTAYHHLYLHDLTAAEQAARIQEVERHYGDWNWEDDCSMLNGPLDAQCFKRTGTSGPSIAEDFRRHGVPWKKSAKDRFNGLAEVCKRLSARMTFTEESREELALAAISSKPMIRWMDNCKAPIEFLPIIPSDPTTNGEDVLKSYPHLHTLDDTMFACMSRPMAAQLSEEDYDDVLDPDDIREMWRQRDSRKIASVLGK